MMMYNSWAGCGERWLKDTLNGCKDFKADGLVLFEQTGCMPVYGIGQMVVDRLNKEMGIPTWRVEGRQLLGRTERTNADFMAGLEAFVNLCMSRAGKKV
jgi:benzoyl-CoA reductase/2-hydroxyglutaryl-CoA dehydratase subunit BcrC/BadD/HgdB